MVATPALLPSLHITFARDVTGGSGSKRSSCARSGSTASGGVAHDFDNLLTAISEYTSLVRERANGDTVLANDVDGIKRAPGRAAELTRQLLAFGRRQVLQPRAVDLATVVEEIADLVARLLGTTSTS